MPGGTSASWQTTAPLGITITNAWLPAISSTNLNQNRGYGGGFYWQGGAQPIYSSNPSGCCSTTFNSPYFGWSIVCGWSTCSNYASITIIEVLLTAQETSGPSISALNANNLWYQNGWVRGTNWPVSFQAVDPSGVCSTHALAGGQSFNGPGGTPDQSTWHQCPDQTMWQAIDTRGYPDGPLSMSLSAVNAAGVATVDTRDSAHNDPVLVDNQPVELSLSGPTDAPSTAGVQYISATASAGPSGVGSIACSLDGGPSQSYPGASTQIPVQGIGSHQLTCTAYNNAVDSAGAPAASTPQTWTLGIRQPTVSSVSFNRVVDALHCARTRARVTIPAHWMTVPWHGQQVRVRVPAQTRRVRIVRCHPRLATVRVRIAGHWRTERVVLLPHTVRSTNQHVRFRSPTTISGWLGTWQGDALAGQSVRVMTAPDDGLQHFTQAAVATTNPDGSWTAQLSAGPSRIVQAIYDGTATMEPSTSTLARVTVPASVNLRIHPRNTRWGGTIIISGRLRGGHIPPAGEVIVLRIGWSGGSTEIGHLYSRQDGRFKTSYTFLRGNGSETYELWATTAAESDYPYGTSSSRRLTVSVRG